MRHTSSSAVGILGLALAASCTPTPTILPSNDLSRPMDIAFMCLGAHGTPGTDADGGSTETSPFVVSGRPMRACHPPPVDDMRQPQPGASISSRMYAFVPNSASGDLSVIDGDSWKLVDLDKATGGFGRAPLGSLPEQISTSSDGCRLVSANRGACDLTVVNPSTLLASRFAAEYNSDTVSVNVPAGNGIQHVEPMRDNGTPLGAAPHEVVFLPTDTSALELGNNLCPADGAGGSWRALATFPGCDLVALLDLPSGNIVSSVKVHKDPSGKIQLTDGTTHPDCLAECGSGRMTNPPDAGAPDPDAGAPDPDGGTEGGTGTPPPQVPTRGELEPTSIAITPRADHAYISFARAPTILSAGLTASGLTTPQNLVELHAGAQGSNRIRLGVDPNAYTRKDPATGKVIYDFAGRFVGDTAGRAYLYVVARDGSLAIIDVAVPGDPANEFECETNFDPFANAPIPPDTRCIKYGSVVRRQYSSDATAGLRFPTPVIDVAAADMTSTPQEETVNGGYAWVLTASSSIYLVNITPQQRQIKAVVYQSQETLFPPQTMCQPLGASCTGPGSCCLSLGCEAKTMTCQTEGFVYKNAVPPMGPGLVSESPPYPNRPRDRNVVSYSISLDPTLGPTRVDVPPPPLLTGPYIDPFYAQGTQDNATSIDPDAHQTYVFFPDREGAIAQGWDVAWQGTIVSPRYSGIINGATLRDDGGGFCSAGVLPGDIVTLRGCGSNGDCPLGMVCHRDPSLDQVEGGLTVTGLCVSSNAPSLQSACARYVSSTRRYDIVDAHQGSLTLKPHLDEIVRSSLTPCQIIPPGTAGMTGAGGAGGGGMAGAGGAAGTGGMAGAAGGAGTGESHDKDCFDPSEPTTNEKPFACVNIGPQPRCLMECETDQDCRRGRICQPLFCTSRWDCPAGTAECRGGMCFTDVVCQDSCISGQSCLDHDQERRCAFNQKNLCADAPPLGQGPDACFPQLTSYQVNVNAGFHVTGTASGSFDAGTTNNVAGTPELNKDNDLCRAFRPTERDPRLVSRIPLRPAPNDDDLTSNECGAGVFPTLQTTLPEGDGYYIDHFDPMLKPTVAADGKEQDVVFGSNRARPEAPQLVEWMKQWTSNVGAKNACLYMGGPIAADTDENNSPLGRVQRHQHARVRFRNTQIAFVLTNIDRAPGAGSTVHFEVHGGFRLQAVLPLPTVEISAPARLVLGPVDSIPKDVVNAKAANFFFVVDQRRLGRSQGGGPTRGQIVRVSPFGYASSNGNQPIFEDYQRSGGLFPIQ